MRRFGRLDGLGYGEPAGVVSRHRTARAAERAAARVGRAIGEGWQVWVEEEVSDE